MSVKVEDWIFPPKCDLVDVHKVKADDDYDKTFLVSRETLKKPVYMLPPLHKSW